MAILIYFYSQDVPEGAGLSRCRPSRLSARINAVVVVVYHGDRRQPESVRLQCSSVAEGITQPDNTPIIKTVLMGLFRHAYARNKGAFFKVEKSRARSTCEIFSRGYLTGLRVREMSSYQKFFDTLTRGTSRVCSCEQKSIKYVQENIKIYRMQYIDS
jgi:hypothetical protein